MIQYTHQTGGDEYMEWTPGIASIIREMPHVNNIETKQSFIHG